jgi:hypothetical protein
MLQNFLKSVMKLLLTVFLSLSVMKLERKERKEKLLNLADKYLAELHYYLYYIIDLLAQSMLGVYYLDITGTFKLKLIETLAI